MPSDEDLRAKINELVGKIDIKDGSMSVKGFMAKLSAELGGVGLKPKKAFVKQALTEAINNQSNDDEEEEESEEESEDDEPAPAAKRGRGGGLAQQKEISDELANLLGKGKMMARTDVVKELWNYIRENDLQNPENRKEILLDKAMRDVFGCQQFTMFSMNKYIGAHIHPFKPVDLTTNTSSSRKRKTKSDASRGGAPKKRKSGMQPPYRLTDALADVVGTDILPRPQVVSMIWKYIKEHGLQNENNKREILCDEKLKKVMGVAKVTMFQMNSHLSKHMIEKVDRSEYNHPTEGASGDDDSD